jgi:putative glutamine amidotransferase
MRPRIGISVDTGTPDENRKVYELNADYPDAVFRAGGLPLLLPHTHDPAVRAQMIALCHGLILPGGADCEPSLYGQQRRACTNPVDPLRQDFELAMLALAEERQLPTLGICFGFQLMNVYRGGSLHQSIREDRPSSVVHARSLKEHHPSSAAHDVNIRPGHALSAIYGEAVVAVNSRHRQGVDRLGRGLRVTAEAPDGLVEAIEDPTLPFFLAVQWHPENMIGTIHERLFAALVDAARKRC